METLIITKAALCIEKSDKSISTIHRGEKKILNNIRRKRKRFFQMQLFIYYHLNLLLLQLCTHFLFHSFRVNLNLFIFLGLFYSPPNAAAPVYSLPGSHSTTASYINIVDILLISFNTFAVYTYFYKYLIPHMECWYMFMLTPRTLYILHVFWKGE